MKQIPGFSDYSAEESGRIFSSVSGKFLKPQVNNAGYELIFIGKKGDRKPFFVHHIILKTFVGELPQGYQCDHINRNKLDNRIENLRYATKSFNSHNAVKTSKLTKFRGVHLCHEGTLRWTARIRKDGKRFTGRYRATDKEAAIDYDEMAMRLIGQSAITNKSLGLL